MTKKLPVTASPVGFAYLMQNVSTFCKVSKNFAIDDLTPKVLCHTMVAWKK